MDLHLVADPATSRQGTTVSICVGGWAGSQFWSGAVSTEAKRQQLVTAIIAIVQKYSLDGVDFE